MSTLPQGLRPVFAFLVLLACGLRPAVAAPFITEFMASNKTTLLDQDGSKSDWIEIYNPDPTPVSLDGWYLTDNASKKNKWQFPAVTIPAGGYLLVFADDKNRRDPAGELHTNFSLSADGEFLGLIKPDATTVASGFAPSFPAQTADISYGLDGSATGPSAPGGYLLQPTPRAANGELGVLERAVFTPTSRTFVGTLAITLAGAGAGQVIRYEIAAPSSDGIESPEPTASSPAYAGPFEISSSVAIRAAVFSADGAKHGLASSAQFVRLAETGDERVDTFSSTLPLVLLDPHGREALSSKSLGEQPAWLHLFAPGSDGLARFTAAPTVVTPIGVKVRGSSSADFPKKSYSVELHDDLGADRPQALLGLANAADWALVSPWGYDRSYLRNAFAYSLSNAIGHWAPRTKFAEMFLKADGDTLSLDNYAGITVLTERIKVAPDLVAIASLSASDVTAPAITGGYILKLDLVDEDEYGFTTDHGIPTGVGNSAFTQVVVAAPKADKLPAAQRDYIRGYVQDFENALFADRDSGWLSHRYTDYIDTPSWVDFHLLNVLTGNLDALERSAYFTKDRGGKLKAGPAWDFDRAMSSADPRAPAADEWNGEQPGTVDFWNSGWWGLLTRDPDFMQAWIDRWQELRRDQFSAGRLVALADGLAAQVSPEAAARDAARWPDNQSRFGDSFLGEVDHLKEYLLLRADWIDRQFLASPTVDADNEDGSTRIVAPEGSLLAYTLDGSDPRGPGGTLSNGTFLTSAPLVLTGRATVNVRVYNPNVTSFPGSPWSGLRTLTTEGLAPQPPIAGNMAPARLFNLSARGTVETDGVLIAGIVVSGDLPKRFLARAIGPTLNAFRVEDALADPVLRVISASGAELARNEGWDSGANGASLAAIGTSVGAFALQSGSHDAALVVELPPGLHTLHITSASGQRGIVLTELYALDDNPARLNLSSRGFVSGGDHLLIGGLNIEGDGPRRVLVRAIGPSLVPYGVGDALAEPALTIFSGATAIAYRDNWSTASEAVAAAAVSVGAFALPPGSKDAALVLNLAPGSYTFQIAGKNGKSGTALFEVYELP